MLFIYFNMNHVTTDYLTIRKQKGYITSLVKKDKSDLIQSFSKILKYA